MFQREARVMVLGSVLMLVVGFVVGLLTPPLLRLAGLRQAPRPAAVREEPPHEADGQRELGELLLPNNDANTFP